MGDAGQERWPLGGLAARPKGPGALQSKPGEVWPTRQADQLPWGLPEGHVEPKEAQRAPQPAGPCPYAPRPLVDQGEVPGRERARPGGRYQRSHPGRRSGGGGSCGQSQVATSPEQDSANGSLMLCRFRRGESLSNPPSELWAPEQRWRGLGSSEGTSQQWPIRMRTCDPACTACARLSQELMPTQGCGCKHSIMTATIARQTESARRAVGPPSAPWANQGAGRRLPP